MLLLNLFEHSEMSSNIYNVLKHEYPWNVPWMMNKVFVLRFYNIMKDQITLNRLSINLTGRTFFITLRESCQNALRIFSGLTHARLNTFFRLSLRIRANVNHFTFKINFRTTFDWANEDWHSTNHIYKQHLAYTCWYHLAQLYKELKLYFLPLIQHLDHKYFSRMHTFL